MTSRLTIRIALSLAVAGGVACSKSKSKKASPATPGLASAKSLPCANAEGEWSFYEVKHSGQKFTFSRNDKKELQFTAAEFTQPILVNGQEQTVKSVTADTTVDVAASATCENDNVIKMKLADEKGMWREMEFHLNPAERTGKIKSKYNHLNKVKEDEELVSLVVPEVNNSAANGLPGPVKEQAK